MRTRKQVVLPNDLENLVWFGLRKDHKGQITQWMDKTFLEVWESIMRECFDLLGMGVRFGNFFAENTQGESEAHEELGKLSPVLGPQNRFLLRSAVSNIDQVTTCFKVRKVGNGTAIVYEGDAKDALEEWRALVEMVGQTTTVSLVTSGLRYYLQGTQVGYRESTRHLFHRKNTLELMGKPNEPSWRANVSGFGITLIGDWEEIKRTRKETGYNILQMLQIRINDGLEEALKGES